MDEFSYLSVMISIVLGLGVTNLLLGLARVVQQRERIVIYWPTLAWTFTLLLTHVQTWWTMFFLRGVGVWTFQLFAIVLLQPVLLFFLSALALPDFDQQGKIDLRRNYFAQTRWFFGILLGLLFVSLLRGAVLIGRLDYGPELSTGGNPILADIAFHLVFIVGIGSGIIYKNETLHKILAVLSVAAISIYISTLFMVLR